MVRGWTLEAAAEHTGVDWKHLQKIEAAQINPTVMTVIRIAEGFGVPVWGLFRGPS
jgi:transcriptional regulator with XRE-family HTH domain